LRRCQDHQNQAFSIDPIKFYIMMATEYKKSRSERYAAQSIMTEESSENENQKSSGKK